MELSGYFRIARRWWLVFVASAVLAALGGYAVASRLPKVYEAEVRVLVGPLNTDLNTQRAAGQLANTYAQLASSSRVTNAVITRLGLDMRSSDLQDDISATANDVTRLVVIRVQDSVPQTAATLANAIAEELGELGSESPRVEGQVTIVDPATASASAVAPQVSLLVLLAAFAGLLTAIICVVFLEYARDLVTSENELRELSGSPTLGTVSTRAYRAADVPSALLSAESGEHYRALAARIEHSFGAKRVGAILVAGVTSDSHAGIVATGIALAFSDRGIPAALIDANSQHPEATRALGLRPAGDLANALAAGQVPLARLTLIAEGASSSDAESRSVRLAVVPSTVDRDLSRVEDLKRLLEAIRTTADVVVITTPPVDRSPEVAMWAGLVDAIVMVAPLPGTKRQDVIASVESLRLSGRAYTGTVVTESARPPRLRRRPRARQFTRVVSQVVAAVTPPRVATTRTRSVRKPPQ